MPLYFRVTVFFLNYFQVRHLSDNPSSPDFCRKMSDTGLMENFTSIAALVAVSHIHKSKPETAESTGVSSSKEPLPYDPLLGWYTAATLSGLLVLFLACVGLEKIKDRILMTFEKNHPSAGRDHPHLGVATGPGAALQPPKGSADTESDALLGGVTPNATARNCVDHNYVFLTLDRQNHATAPLSLPAVRSASPTAPASAPTGRLGPQLGTGEWEDPARTSTTGRTHNVKIEIVEVHSESPIHDMAIIEERDVGLGGGDSAAV